MWEKLKPVLTQVLAAILVAAAGWLSKQLEAHEETPPLYWLQVPGLIVAAGAASWYGFKATPAAKELAQAARAKDVPEETHALNALRVLHRRFRGNPQAQAAVQELSRDLMAQSFPTPIKTPPEPDSQS